MESVRAILDKVGIGGERVQMYNLSSSDGPRFAEFAAEMTEKIRAMGPNPLKAARWKMAS